MRKGEGALDVALPRRESKSGRGHKGFQVVGDPFMTIEEAARRRDFTINAISWDPLTDGLRRPVQWQRPTSTDACCAPSILEPLAKTACASCGRSSSLPVSNSPSTTRPPTLCRSIALDDLPAERVWTEVEKLLLAAERPSIGLALALELGVVDTILPELRPLVGCEQEPDWHPEGDVWTHTLMVVDKARELNADLERPQLIAVMLGAVCHDLGKPSTTAVIDGRIRSMNHEEAGVAPTLSAPRSPQHPRDRRLRRAQPGVGLVAHHLKPGDVLSKPRRSAMARSGGSHRRSTSNCWRASRARTVWAARATFDCSAMDWFLQRARSLGVEHRPPAPLLLGRHLLALGLSPGPQVGAILKHVYERQLDGEVSTVDEAMRTQAVSKSGY